jgi:hypothetical protein
MFQCFFSLALFVVVVWFTLESAKRKTRPTLQQIQLAVLVLVLVLAAVVAPVAVDRSNCVPVGESVLK